MTVCLNSTVMDLSCWRCCDMRSTVIALSQLGFYFICFFQRAQYRCLRDFVCFYFRLSKYLGCCEGRVYVYILTLFWTNALKQDL